MQLQIAAQTLQFIRRVSSLWINARDLGRDIAELAKLEAKLAVASIISMALLSAAAALLFFTGWILLISSLVAWLAEDLLSLPVSLLLVGLLATIGAVPLVFMARQRSGDLHFKATRRQLGGRS
jgi:uncharacterized membrane protein YqjE